MRVPWKSVLWGGAAALATALFLRPKSRVRVEAGVLIGPGDVRYRLTSEDRLWLGRAVLGETGGADRTAAAAVLWALAQNFMLVIGSGGARPRFASMTAMARAYCQPINPAWSVAGEGHCLDRPEACTEAKLSRRARVQSTSWSALPEATRSAVEAFFAGTLPNPVPGATDWSGAFWAGATRQVGGNWFGVSSGRRLVA